MISLEQLVSQLPSERKAEKRVVTLLMCGDDDQVLEAMYTVMCTSTPYAGTEAPVEQELDDIEEQESSPDEFRVPKVLRNAKSALGSVGSFISDLNKDFANIIGLTDSDSGKQGKPGEVYGVLARNMLRVCTRTVQSPRHKNQPWRVFLVWVKTRVPSYEGWRRVMRCVCSPARFPNACVWFVRSQEEMLKNPDTGSRETPSKVIPRLSKHVPIIQLLCNREVMQILALDGQSLTPGSDGLALALLRTGLMFPTAQQLSSARIRDTHARKTRVRKIIKESVLGSAMGVFMPVPLLDTGAIIVVEMRMVNAITDKYAEMAPSHDIELIQKNLRMLMAPAVMALLPLQRIKLLPTGGVLINMGANALLTFGLGVATAQLFEKVVEHQMLFDEGLAAILKTDLKLLKSQASALLGDAATDGKSHIKKLLNKGKVMKLITN